MRRAALCFQLILCIMLLAVTVQAAEPYIAAKAYWVDSGRKATLEDVLSSPFVVYDGTITQGYTESAVWLRITVSGQTTSEPLALTVKPAFVSKVELYDPLFAKSGDSYPILSGRDARIESDNHVGLDNGFIIAASKQPRDVFLRITTSTSLSADVSVVPLIEAQKSVDVEGAILAVYFALLLGFCLWGVVNFGIRRENIYAMFVIRMVYSMAHLFVFIGLLRYFFSDELSAATRDFIYTFVTVTIIFVTGSFDVRLLGDFGVSRWLQRVFRFVLFLPAISLTLLLLGRVQAALHANVLIVSFVMILLCLLALSARNTERDPYERLGIIVVRAGFILMTLVIIVPAFMHQNLIKANSSIIHSIFLHAVISATILSALLSIRARQRDWEAQQALIKYQLKEQELQTENERRIEKERFLSMLTHELRNPLALIRLVTNTDTPSGKTVERAALEMTGVIERVEQSEMLDDKAIQVHMTRVDLKAVLRDLAAHSPAAERLELDVQGDCAVFTDEGLVRSIVKNLLENAEKYSPAGSRIGVAAIVETVHGAEGVRISFSNDVGDAGVPDPERLFTKYYRSRRAHRHPGSGLGLFLVSNWVKAMGGKVSYECHENDDASQSVTFSVWLPN